MKKLMSLISLAIAVILISCSSAISSKEKTDTKISGTIENYRGGTLVLQEIGLQKLTVIDTIDVSETGEFQYYAAIDGPTFARLTLGQNNFMNVIIQQNDQLNVTADGNNLGGTFKVTGSEENNRLIKLNEVLGNAYTKMDSIRKAMQQAQMTGNAQAYQAAAASQNQFSNKMQNELIQFIEENPGSFASFAALQNLDLNKQYETYKKVTEGLATYAPNSPFYTSLKQQVASVAKLAIGAEAPDIALPNPSGEMVKLSSLRGKVVLIDFWASWCKPCRMENPNVVRMYKKYNEKGFEIFGVSLDKNKDAWVKAIGQDGLTWKHVSDLQFWNSAGAKLYNVSAIPKTFLIDEEGKIIGKDLRGPSLEAKLEELFGS